MMQIKFRNWLESGRVWQFELIPTVAIFRNEYVWCIAFPWLFWCIEIWINPGDDLT
jgi:hypothetical protein